MCNEVFLSVWCYFDDSGLMIIMKYYCVHGDPRLTSFTNKPKIRLFAEQDESPYFEKSKNGFMGMKSEL